MNVHVCRCRYEGGPWWRARRKRCTHICVCMHMKMYELRREGEMQTMCIHIHMCICTRYAYIYMRGALVEGETQTMRVCVTDLGREIVYLGLYAALST